MNSRYESLYNRSKPDILRLRFCEDNWRSVGEYRTTDSGEAAVGFRLWSERVVRDGIELLKSDGVDRREVLEHIHRARCARGRNGSVHDYMVALEEWVPWEKKFYLPRAWDIRGNEVLRLIARDLQDLMDERLDGLSVSMPMRTGKTEIGKRFTAQIMGMYHDKSVFFTSHTDAMARKVHSELLDIINGGRYSWKDIFPGIGLVDKSAEDKYIDVGEVETYKSFYARGIDANMSGILEASILLYCDDLIRNSEEARNPERVQAAVLKYSEDIRQRRTGSQVKELHIGTRWSTRDVIGVLEEEHANNPRWRFRRIPALNEAEESNFDYYVLPLTKKHFEEQKRLMFVIDGSDISFNMMFQQEPGDRAGILFPRGRLHFYEELPKEQYDRAVAAIDVAFGGDDFFSMPVGLCYDLDVRIEDLVYVNKENATKEKTVPLAVDMVRRYNISAVHVESNNGGSFWADLFRDALRESGIRCAVTDAKVPTNKSKNDRVVAALPEILHADSEGYKIWFRKDGGPQYNLAMQHLTRYNGSHEWAGKQVDDFPDSIASLVTNVLGVRPRTAVVASGDRKGLGL